MFFIIQRQVEQMNKHFSQQTQLLTLAIGVKGIVFPELSSNMPSCISNLRHDLDDDNEKKCCNHSRNSHDVYWNVLSWIYPVVLGPYSANRNWSRAYSIGSHFNSYSPILWEESDYFAVIFTEGYSLSNYHWGHIYLLDMDKHCILRCGGILYGTKVWKNKVG